MARDQLDIIGPGGDFIYMNSYAMLIQDVTSGFFVGKAIVGGVKCDHLAFRGKDVDWQIWIQQAGSEQAGRCFQRVLAITPQAEIELDRREW